MKTTTTVTREIELKPVVGEQVEYTPLLGKPSVSLTIEKVIDDDTIDAVASAPSKSHTPQRFSNIKHDSSCQTHTWRYPIEEARPLSSTSSHVAPPPAAGAPAAPWQGRRRWTPPVPPAPVNKEQK